MKPRFSESLLKLWLPIGGVMVVVFFVAGAIIGGNAGALMLFIASVATVGLVMFFSLREAEKDTSEADFTWAVEYQKNKITYRLKAFKHESRFIRNARASIILYLVMALLATGGCGFMLLNIISGLRSSDLPTFIPFVLVVTAMVFFMLRIGWGALNNLVVFEVQLDSQEHRLYIRGLRPIRGLETLSVPFADIRGFQHDSSTYKSITQHRIYVVLERTREVMFNSLLDEEYRNILGQLHDVDAEMFKDL